jgi:hypothetical protein
MSNIPMLGFTAETADNVSDPASQLEALKGGFCSELFGTCGESVPRDDPAWAFWAYWRLHRCFMASMSQSELGRGIIKEALDHDIVTDVIEGYDHDLHHPMFNTCPVGTNMYLSANTPAALAFLYYGDLPLVRTAMLQMCTIFESNDARTDPTLFAPAYYLGLTWAHPLVQASGFSDLSLRLLKALHSTFTEAEASAAIYNGVMQFFGFTGKTHCYATQSYWVAQGKRRHWLLAPDEVGKAAMEEWLSQTPAEWGSSGQGELIDCGPYSVGFLAGCGCAEVFESFERYEEGIIAAETDIRNWPTLVSNARTRRIHTKTPLLSVCFKLLTHSCACAFSPSCSSSRTWLSGAATRSWGGHKKRRRHSRPPSRTRSCAS